MKAFELSFNLIALFIMGLLVVVLVAGHFTGQSSQIFSKLSSFGRSTTAGHIGVAEEVCIQTNKCRFEMEKVDDKVVVCSEGDNAPACNNKCTTEGCQCVQEEGNYVCVNGARAACIAMKEKLKGDCKPVGDYVEWTAP